MITAYKNGTDFTPGRSDWADTLKAIVIFFVCINHHFAQDRENYRAIWLYLSSFDVPLFFFLGGLFFKEGAMRLPLSSILIKKFKTRIIPYFAFGAFTYMVWLALYVLHQTGIYHSGVTAVHPIKPIIGMFYGNATNNWLIHNAALWFLPCYFVAELVFHALKKYVPRNPAFPAVVGLLALSGYLYSLTSLPLLPFGGDLALVMLIFFLCGHVLRNYLLAYNLRTWVIIILFCTGFLFSLINGHVSVHRRMYDNIHLFYVSALCSTIAWVEISKRLVILKPITYIGQNTLPIFVLQVFAMRIIFWILEKVLGTDVYAHTSLLDFVLFVMAEFAVLIPVIYVLNRFTPSIVGKYAPHSHAASQRSVVVTPP